MVGLPDTITVEIEFNAGTWTDVTADIDAQMGLDISKGRTSEFTTPQTGTAGLQLFNDTGKYTPGVQVLLDGVTAAPYYPLIRPRLRVRISYVVATVRYVRYVGYVRAWAPLLDGDESRPYVAISSTDRLDQLASVGLLAPMIQMVIGDRPMVLYALTEASGATLAVDSSGNNYLPLGIAQLGAAGGTLAFGGIGPGPEDGTGLVVAAGGVAYGPYLTANLPMVDNMAAFPGCTWEVWVNTTQANVTILSAGNKNDVQSVAIQVSAGLIVVSGGGVGRVGPVVNDGLWHHVVFLGLSGLGPAVLYVDGVSYAVTGAPSWGSNGSSPMPHRLNVGASMTTAGYAANAFTGAIGYVAFYYYQLSTTQITAHYLAGHGYPGDLTGARIARYLALGGLAPAEMNLDPGHIVVGHYQTAGVSILQACQDMAQTEGGGAVFYVAPDGRARFIDRAYRSPGPPVLTVDAQADADGSGFAPSLDDLALVNRVTVSRNSGSGVASTQIVSDPVSITLNNLSEGSVTSWAVSDADALTLAQYAVTSQSEPSVRLPALTVDMLTAQSAGLYAAVAAIEIGSRIRIVNMLAGTVAASSQLDVIVEGWHETIGVDHYSITFDASPADSPARGKWDNATYGRWQPVTGAMTLTAAITAGALAASISSTGSPLTTSAAAYPLAISVGAEIVTITAAPVSAVSPQAVTITRASAGTRASAQAAGAVLALVPVTTWSI